VAGDQWKIKKGSGTNPPLSPFVKGDERGIFFVDFLLLAFFFHWSLVTGHWTLRQRRPAADAARVHFLLAYRGGSVHNARKETDNGYAQHPVLAADAYCLSRSSGLLTGSLSGTGSVPRRCERLRHCGSRDSGGEGV